MFIIFNDVQYLLWYIIFHIKLYGILKKKGSYFLQNFYFLPSSLIKQCLSEHLVVRARMFSRFKSIWIFFDGTASRRT
jgi:hypothetical protein